MHRVLKREFNGSMGRESFHEEYTNFTNMLTSMCVCIFVRFFFLKNTFNDLPDGCSDYKSAFDDSSWKTAVELYSDNFLTLGSCSA